MSNSNLRNRINALFMPELCKVSETTYRDIFLVRQTRKTYRPNHIPSIAKEIAAEGSVLHSGITDLTLERWQNIRSRFGKETVTTDTVRCALTDIHPWDGSVIDTPYVYDANMLQPEIRYDEKLARIIQVCLEAADVSI